MLDGIRRRRRPCVVQQSAAPASVRRLRCFPVTPLRPGTLILRTVRAFLPRKCRTKKSTLSFPTREIKTVKFFLFHFPLPIFVTSFSLSPLLFLLEFVVEIPADQQRFFCVYFGGKIEYRIFFTDTPTFLLNWRLASD